MAKIRHYNSVEGLNQKDCTGRSVLYSVRQTSCNKSGSGKENFKEIYRIEENFRWDGRKRKTRTSTRTPKRSRTQWGRRLVKADENWSINKIFQYIVVKGNQEVVGGFKRRDDLQQMSVKEPNQNLQEFNEKLLKRRVKVTTSKKQTKTRSSGKEGKDYLRALSSTLSIVWTKSRENIQTGRIRYA